MFQKHNNTNFTTAMRPILKSLFYMKYEGKDGAQNLQRDLRYIKIATNSQIPEDQSLDHINNLISKGKSSVSSTVDPFVTSDNVLKQNADVYGNGYPMYPANPTTSSTAPACAANPPLPLDSPPKKTHHCPRTSKLR